MKPQISDVHPELQAGATKIPQFTLNKWTLRVVRFLTRLQRSPKAPDDISIENIFIPLPDSQKQMRLRIYKPKSVPTPTPVLLWLHGGGYIIGTPEVGEVACTEYVRELGIVVVSVEYRMAPDYPFPTSLEDGYTALKWLISHAQQLGIDVTRIAIGGESAGSGLAAALVQMTIDRKEIKPIFQLLVYPMLDDRTATRTELANKGYFAWNQASNYFGWQSYLGKKPGTADLPAYAVPAHRADLSGLPPAWIGVGMLDLFHDEDVAYAQRLKDSGVECELVEVAGAFHGFDIMSPEAQVVQDFRKSQIAALKRYLFPVAQPAKT